MKIKEFLYSYSITIIVVMTGLAVVLINTDVHKQATIKMKKKMSFEVTNYAQEAERAVTIAVLTRYEVKKELHQKFREVLGAYVRHARSQEDNMMAEAYYEKDNPFVYWRIERWNNKSALNKNNNSPQLAAIRALEADALLQPPSIIYATDLEPITKEAWRRTPGKEDRPFTIMLFVDSKPGTEKLFEQVYHTAMPAFRSEPGVINYQLSRFESDSTRFVTYEKFRNEDAFQYHLKFPPIQPVLDYLNTNIKKPPFQDGIHTLIEFAPLTPAQ